ncbi:MAG: ROK family protein [Clostridiales bacterium]|nr:ROK family protein [Clostridiales bacterium]
MPMYTLGADIGGTKCAVILGRGELPRGDAGDFIIDKRAFPTRTGDGWQSVVDEILSEADELLAKNGISPKELVGIGISCGGPLDSTRGVILSPPNLPGWDAVPITEMFEKHFGIRAYLRNDANACALAEWRFGAARGSKNAVFLTFGTGMGAGLILDGRLYSGTNDMAGEVGHIRLAADGPEGYGKKGSFEGFCSGGGIARLAKHMAEKAFAQGRTSSLFACEKDIHNITAKSVALAADGGDALAGEIYDICAEKLGTGLSVLIDVLNPEIIVIGSIYARNEARFLPKITKIIEAEALPLSASVCRVLPAALGENIGDFAALSAAFEGE